MAGDTTLDSVAVIRPTVFELFTGIPEVDRSRIGRFCGERRYAEGASIFSEGDPADAMFIVESGLVNLVSVSSTGAETILHILKRGDIFGELFFAEERRAFDAVAGADVVVTVIPRRGFEEILATVPAVARNFIRLLSRRLVRVERGYAGFGHTWSYHRLGKVLLRLAGEHGVPAAGGTMIPLRLTHEDLAKLIGTTRETVTKQMGRFRRAGLLRREGRHIVLHTGRLSRFVSSEERTTVPGTTR